MKILTSDLGYWNIKDRFNAAYIIWLFILTLFLLTRIRMLILAIVTLLLQQHIHLVYGGKSIFATV